MSKAPKNIEKILLAVGVLAGGGLAALGFMKNGKATEDFGSSIPEPRDAETSVPGSEKVPGTLNSLTSDRQFAAAMVDAASLEEGKRPVDLFVGVSLYASRDNPNDPIDPVTSEDIHPPIPNAWWLKYGAQPNFADSPQRDDDGDGFTNLEEFEAGTHPTNGSIHPPLIAKLSFIKDESSWWFLEFGNFFNGQWTPKMETEGGSKFRVGFAAPLKEGDLFFSDAPPESGFMNRFKFLKVEDRTVRNERLNIDEQMQFAIVEDQRENKKGMIHEIPNRIPRPDRPKFRKYDRSAVFELGAIGQEGKEFKVEENTRFALPQDGKEKTYLLKEVTPEKVVIEWEEDGETRSVEIPKGGLPDIDLKKK
ncbi:MAG: thrombospondin type 3 repeat-containing protein [Akkermansiaceae bacterium]|jgi:hypothetical protein|nr:thrombospondin type 3 repeat-containing protein [Akkermansiaceae bacterium]